MEAPPNIAAAAGHAFSLGSGIIGIQISRKIMLKKPTDSGWKSKRIGVFTLWCGILVVVGSAAMIVVDIFHPLSL